MSHWNRELSYYITPKSGPMRPMRTLADVNRSLLDDIPFRSRLKPHWAIVRRLLLRASETGQDSDILWLTEALLCALETEKWMSAPPPSE